MIPRLSGDCEGRERIRRNNSATNNADLQLKGGRLQRVMRTAHRIWPEPEHVSNIIQSGASGWRQALVGLLIVWTFASFGEE